MAISQHIAETSSNNEKVVCLCFRGSHISAQTTNKAIERTTRDVVSLTNIFSIVPTTLYGSWVLTYLYNFKWSCQCTHSIHHDVLLCWLLPLYANRSVHTVGYRWYQPLTCHSFFVFPVVGGRGWMCLTPFEVFRAPYPGTKIRVTRMVLI